MSFRTAGTWSPSSAPSPTARRVPLVRSSDRWFFVRRGSTFGATLIGRGGSAFASGLHSCQSPLSSVRSSCPATSAASGGTPRTQRKSGTRAPAARSNGADREAARTRRESLPWAARAVSTGNLPESAPRAKYGLVFQVAQADAVEWLHSLPAASVDLVVTDPPYESLEKHRAIGTTTRLKRSKASSNDWFTIFPNARFEALFDAVHRVLKKDAHFYLFCDPETMFVAKPIA